ncbi:MAG TPA: MMPL family transporter, partial [Amnibacterium sp.]|nr:MMPL family transporter [Amnibacterium sp.]
AFLVRMTLVPAVMLLVGRAGWYLPRWLDRILPSVDIEGEGLAARREQLAWAAGQEPWLLSAERLVAAAPFTTDPIDLRVVRGGVTTLAVPAPLRRGVVATLTGHLVPERGALQIDGHPTPSEAADVRRLAAPVLDDGTAARASVGELITERLRAAPRSARSGSVAIWLERIRTAEPALGATRSRLDRHTPLGALVAEERLVVLAAAALAGGAEVVVLDVGDIGREAERRLAAALPRLTDGGAAAVLVTASAEIPIGAPDTARKVPASR